MNESKESFFRHKIEEAAEIVQKVDPNYRSQAFAEVLRALLATEDKKLLSHPLPQQTSLKADPIRFLMDSGVTSHADRVLVMAYFLEKSGQKDEFTVNDIKEMYRRCRVKEPANLFDIILKQNRRGLLTVREERDGIKVYVLTLQGIQYVERSINTNKEIPRTFPELH